MPTRERVRSAVIEVSERLYELGIDEQKIQGPVDEDNEDISEAESSEAEDITANYYLIANTSRGRFYIIFSTGLKYAHIVYPMDVLNQISVYIEEDEVTAILNQSIDWDELDHDEKAALFTDAVDRITQNTDPIVFHRAKFNLSAYASTSLVSYNVELTDNGFPREFQCDRGLFPYTERMSLERLDDKIMSVLNAGERGRRYVEHAFIIEKEDKEPSAYEIQCLI